MQEFPHTLRLRGMGQTEPGPRDAGLGTELREPEPCGTQGQTAAAVGSLLHGKPLNLTGDNGQTQRRQEIKSLTLEGIDVSRSTDKPRTTGDRSRIGARTRLNLGSELFYYHGPGTKRCDNPSLEKVSCCSSSRKLGLRQIPSQPPERCY